jgi:hypothetical protein
MRAEYKNKSYFDNYLRIEKKNIDEFKEIVERRLREHGDTERGVQNGLGSIFMYYQNIVEILYSSGAPVNEIKAIFPEIYYYFLKTWDKYSYRDMIDVASLAIMLGITKEEYQEALDMVRKEGLRDYLIDFLLNGIDPSWGRVSEKFKFKKPYAALQNVIEAETPAAAVNAMKNYLEKKWYSGNSDTGWHDSHLKDDYIYSGYWSFEAGAVMKILGHDDEVLKSVKYYPYDLVHFTDK